MFTKDTLLAYPPKAKGMCGSCGAETIANGMSAHGDRRHNMSFPTFRKARTSRHSLWTSRSRSRTCSLKPTLPCNGRKNESSCGNKANFRGTAAQTPASAERFEVASFFSLARYSEVLSFGRSNEGLISSHVSLASSEKSTPRVSSAPRGSSCSKFRESGYGSKCEEHTPSTTSKKCQHNGFEERHSVIRDLRVISAAFSQQALKLLQRDLGAVDFRLSYDKYSQQLRVTINAAHGVGMQSNKAWSSRNSGTYIKIKINEGNLTAKTKTVFTTVDPIFNEEFTFNLSKSCLASASLRLLVCRKKQLLGFSSTKIVGEVWTDLMRLQKESSIDFHEELSTTSALQLPMKEPTLTLSLCYQPCTGNLEIVVMRANNLKSFGIFGEPSTEVHLKVTQITSGDEVQSSVVATQAIRNNSNPQFQQKFCFPVERVRYLSKGFKVSCEVVCKDIIRRRRVMGVLSLGSGVKQHSERNHWMQLLKNPGQRNEMTHNLSC